MKVITIHSFKGGTGKSLIATNLAVLYAVKGHSTCLVDMDFRAPTLHVAFDPQQVKYWFNDYLDGKCSEEEVLVELSEKLGLKAKFSVAFANPSPEAIREMMAKPPSWESHALRKLLDFTRKLEKLGYEYCVIDTSPGYLYSSINALVAADVAIVISTTDDSDIEGTRRMLSELYRLLERRVSVVINKVVGDLEEVIKSLREKIGEEVAGAITCSCDITRRTRRVIYAIEEPNHPFIKELENIATKTVD